MVILFCETRDRIQHLTHAGQIVLPSRLYDLNKVGWEQDGTEMESHTKKEKVGKTGNQRSIGTGAEVGASLSGLLLYCQGENMRRTPQIPLEH